MNNKELFWSLISPYLVDRPKAINRVNWDIDYIMEHHDTYVNNEFKRFVRYNHIFRMPSNLRWRTDMFSQNLSMQGNKTLDLEQLQSRYPHSMIITKSERGRVGNADVLYFILDGRILAMEMTPMLNSKTEYVIGKSMQIIEKAQHIRHFHPIRGKYAIVGQNPTFINWNSLPWSDK